MREANWALAIAVRALVPKGRACARESLRFTPKGESNEDLAKNKDGRVVCAGDAPAPDRGRSAGTTATFRDDFSGGIDPDFWTVVSNQPLFTIDESGDGVFLNKPFGGNGWGHWDYVFLCFTGEVTGDFTASIDFNASTSSSPMSAATPSPSSPSSAVRSTL